MKRILLVAVLLLLSAAAYFAIELEKRLPIRKIPFPYQFKQMSWNNIEEAKEANILIIGDRQGLNLSPYHKTLQEMTGQRIRTPLKIFNWAWPGEGLHRTLAQLSSLDKLPPLIIYLGGHDEYYEAKLDIKYKDEILENFKRYDNDLLLSAIEVFPYLSKFLYKLHPILSLSRKPTAHPKYLAPEKQQVMEMTFKIYQYELRELIRMTKSKGAKLVLVTSPINLDVEPLEVCSNTTNPEIERKQNEIQGLIEENAYKSAYRQLKSLREDSIANARTYFMLGQVQKKLGQTTKAKQSLTLASAYDCSLWRGGPVFNNIMRQEAKENNISLVDFDQIVNQQYGRNVLFLDDSYPQNIFYRAFTLELSKIVKKEFNL